MAARFYLLLFAGLCSALQVMGTAKCTTSFVQRTLTRIKTPALLQESAAPQTYPVTLAQPVTLAPADPWKEYPRIRHRQHYPPIAATVLMVSGVLFALAGYIAYKNPSDDYFIDTNRILGIFLLVSGAACLLAGLIVMLSAS